MTNDELTDRIARNVQSLRENKGWSIPELARRAGVTRAYAYDVEHAIRPHLSLAVALRISNALEVPLTALYSTDETPRCATCEVLASLLEDQAARRQQAIRILNDYPRPDSDGAL